MQLSIGANPLQSMTMKNSLASFAVQIGILVAVVIGALLSQIATAVIGVVIGALGGAFVMAALFMQQWMQSVVEKFLAELVKGVVARNEVLEGYLQGFMERQTVAEKHLEIVSGAAVRLSSFFEEDEEPDAEAGDGGADRPIWWRWHPFRVRRHWFGLPAAPF